MISLYKTKIEIHVSEITVSEIIINTFDFFFFLHSLFPPVFFYGE